jgi:hypothetical protein
MYKEDGTLIGAFANGSPLNQPWGFAVAPANFGPLSNTLLVSNNTTGTINAFIAKGQFVDTVKTTPGRPYRKSINYGRLISAEALPPTAPPMPFTLPPDHTTT